MKLRKPLSLLLTAVLALGLLSACGGGDDTPGIEGAKSGVQTDTVIFKNEGSVELGTPAKTLDPKTVYANMTYTPEMFYGHYSVPGKDDAVKKQLADLPMMDYQQDYSEQLTSIPHEFRAGYHTLSHKINYVTEYNWMEAHFYNEKGNLSTLLCAYSIDGHTLTLRPLSYYKYEKEEDKIVYELGETELRYGFSFSGTALTLTRDGHSLTLNGALDAYGEVSYLHVENYLSGEVPAGNLKNLDLTWDPTGAYGDKGYTRIYNTMFAAEGESHDPTYRTSVASLSPDGLLTMTLCVDQDGNTETSQYVFFYCDDDGFVLTDGKTNFYYNFRAFETYAKRLAKSVSSEEREKLEKLDEDKLQTLIETKEDLLDDLTAAFSDAGISVYVNRDYGELSMNATVLFGGDSAVLTDEGKAFLNKFISAYAAIACSEKYKGFIRETVVEGHIAPVAGVTYEGGLPLSEERANNVKDYCLSAEAGLGETEEKLLKDKLTAVGFSNLRPVMKTDGSPDMEASRRVSFRFLIDIDAI